MTRLLDRVRSLYPGASRRRVKAWLEGGRVAVNGVVARDGRVEVGEADRVALVAPAGASRARRPSALRVVHEDGDLIVVDKPPGLLTIATDRERHRTLYRLVWNHLAARRPPRRPFIVHRLDQETSGLLVFATSPGAKRALQSQFEQRTAERRYVAVVEGRVRAEGGTLESRLAQDRSLRVKSGPAGRTAVTHYQVLRRRRDTTALALQLGTGRRHQIRVQLAELGHPIAGDRQHGGRRDPFRRLALHASGLAFTHPGTGERMRFESAPPGGWV